GEVVFVDIGHAVVVVVRVPRVAQAVRLVVGTVVGGIEAAHDGAVVTRVVVGVRADVWVERGDITRCRGGARRVHRGRQIAHAIVVVVRIAGVALTVHVVVGAVAGGVVRSLAAIVAG